MSGRFEILYGRNAVIEAMRGERRHRRLWVAAGSERQERIAGLLDLARDRSVPINRPHAREIDRIAGNINHQGVALETSPYPYRKLDDILADPAQRPILILDHVQDPQNLGTLLRTADATGVAGVIIPEWRSAGITPAVVNASSGAVEHVRVVRVINLGRAVAACKEAGYWIVGLERREEAQTLFSATIPSPTGLLIGSEGKGIGAALLGHCDLVIGIPMVGQVQSLNAAVAGSIALYELLRRKLETTR